MGFGLLVTYLEVRNDKEFLGNPDVRMRTPEFKPEGDLVIIYFALECTPY